jgi:hypothetical protein
MATHTVAYQKNLVPSASRWTILMPYTSDSSAFEFYKFIGRDNTKAIMDDCDNYSGHDYIPKILEKQFIRDMIKRIDLENIPNKPVFSFYRREDYIKPHRTVWMPKINTPNIPVSIYNKGDCSDDEYTKLIFDQEFCDYRSSKDGDYQMVVNNGSNWGPIAIDMEPQILSADDFKFFSKNHDSDFSLYWMNVCLSSNTSEARFNKALFRFLMLSLITGEKNIDNILLY